jgi:hypothetical protein
MTSTELKIFLAQEMNALREKKTTTEVANTQAKLASQLSRVLEHEERLAKAISRAPNVENILSRIRSQRSHNNDE